MYPTAMEDLMQIADEGKLMPPKSTWFEPKAEKRSVYPQAFLKNSLKQKSNKMTRNYINR